MTARTGAGAGGDDDGAGPGARPPTPRRASGCRSPARAMASVSSRARGVAERARRPGAGCRRRGGRDPLDLDRAGRQDRAELRPARRALPGRRRPRAPRPPATTDGGARRPRARRSGSGRRRGRRGGSAAGGRPRGRRGATVDRCCRLIRRVRGGPAGPAASPLPQVPQVRQRRRSAWSRRPGRSAALPGAAGGSPGLGEWRSASRRSTSGPDHRDVTGADGQHEVAGAGEAGDRRRRLRPGRHVVASRPRPSTASATSGAADARHGVLPGGVDVHDARRRRRVTRAARELARRSRGCASRGAAGRPRRAARCPRGQLGPGLDDGGDLAGVVGVVVDDR